MSGTNGNQKSGRVVRGRRHDFSARRGKCDYRELDGEKLLECIQIVGQAGGAVRLGFTRDGGAFAIGVYGDGEAPYTDYITDVQTLKDYLESLEAAMTAS